MNLRKERKRVPIKYAKKKIKNAEKVYDKMKLIASYTCIDADTPFSIGQHVICMGTFFFVVFFT